MPLQAITLQQHAPFRDVKHVRFASGVLMRRAHGGLVLKSGKAAQRSSLVAALGLVESGMERAIFLRSRFASLPLDPGQHLSEFPRHLSIVSHPDALPFNRLNAGSKLNGA